jgi:hypothetical protein
MPCHRGPLSDSGTALAVAGPVSITSRNFRSDQLRRAVDEMLSGKIKPILTRLPLRKQINCEQREQKVGNKHCRASVVFRDSLSKK